MGPKTAKRVVNELKDKAPTVMALGAQGRAMPEAQDEVIDTSEPPVPAPQPEDAGAQAAALSALQNLGYGPGEAAGAVAQAAGDGASTESDLIRAALKLLAPKG